MDRLACLDLPALPLQLLGRERPSLRERPAVVLESDRPQALVTHVNQAARALGILPGLRYTAALSLCAELESGVVQAEALAEAQAQLLDCLRQSSPRVEASQEALGVYWIDASGLRPLYASLIEWATQTLDRVRALGLEGRLLVGFGRLGSLALARSGPPGICVLDTPAQELAEAQAVALSRLTLPRREREALARLGVHTLGGLMRLPPGGLRLRFGAATARLQQLARGERYEPLVPMPPPQPLVRSLLADSPETDRNRLLVALKGKLDELLLLLEARGEALASLSLSVRTEGGPATPQTFTLSPAAPTLDGPQLAELMRLRLAQIPIRRGCGAGGGVLEATLSVCGRHLPKRQALLFASRPKRDLAAGARALARLRAQYGEASVARLRLRDAHLPEAQVALEHCPTLEQAAPKPGRASVVRRLWRQARPLPGSSLGGSEGSVTPVGSAQLISGGWWQREVRRQYHYVRTPKGALLWVYYDQVRRRWRLQGQID